VFAFLLRRDKGRANGVAPLNGFAEIPVGYIPASARGVPEPFTPAGTYPATYGGGPITKGMSFRILADGAMGAQTVQSSDILSALTDAPGQTDANWHVSNGNVGPASEVLAGIAELATQSETDAGTDDTRIVTPVKLAGRAATESLSGIAELATQAETNAGTDDARIVTPLKLATRVATDALAGIVELATQAEVDTGTDAGRVITPATFAASSWLPYQATIGATSAQYATVNAAYAAGKRRLLAVSNVTEVSNTTITEDLSIHARNNVAVDFGDYKAIIGAVITVNITSDWDGAYRWAHTTGTPLFDAAGFTTAILNVGKCNLTNQSTVANTMLCNCNFDIKSVLAVAPNVASGMFTQTDTATLSGNLSDVGIVGGGASCEKVINVAKGLVSDVSLSGTYKTTAGTYAAVVGAYGEAHGWALNASCNVNVNGGRMSNVNDDGVTVTIDVTGNESVLSTALLQATGTLRLLSGTEAKLTGVKFGTFSIDASVTNALAAACHLGAMTVSGDGNEFVGCQSSSVSVPSGADSNIFDAHVSTGAVSITGNRTQYGGRVGAEAGGGAVTITINAGATDTKLNNPACDAAVVDNGTNTVGTYTVY